jgi:hypothetical protein
MTLLGTNNPNPETDMTIQDLRDCELLTETTVKGIKCWKYTGDYLPECIDYAAKVKASGENFLNPITGEIAYSHKVILSKSMVILLAAMQHYHDYQDKETMAYPNDFPVTDNSAARGFSGNYNYLVHFGFLGKQTIKGEVRYWVTDLGREFLSGKPIFRILFNCGTEVLGFDKSTECTIDTFFTAAELSEMKKPLWFVDQKFREQVLTTEELAIGEKLVV